MEWMLLFITSHTDTDSTRYTDLDIREEYSTGSNSTRGHESIHTGNPFHFDRLMDRFSGWQEFTFSKV